MEGLTTNNLDGRFLVFPCSSAHVATLRVDGVLDESAPQLWITTPSRPRHAFLVRPFSLASAAGCIPCPRRDSGVVCSPELRPSPLTRRADNTVAAKEGKVQTF